MKYQLFEIGAIIYFLLTIPLYPQIEFGIGMYAGGGIISSNSPTQSSFTSSIFIQGGTIETAPLLTRLSFVYAADFNSLLPGSTNRYYPFIKGINLKSIYEFPLNTTFDLETGLGLQALNDRTYIDRNNWGYGFVFSLLAGLAASRTGNFDIGAGIEYGLNVISNYAKYFSVHLQGVYSF